MNSLFRRLFYDQEGQVLYLVAALMTCILGMAALSIDIGFALHGQRELQASADAAATAGAADISNDDTAAGAKQYAKNFDGVTGSNNAIKDLNNVQMASGYPQVQCLSYLTKLDMMCSNNAGGNALAVVETATAPTFFGKLFGINQINLTATSLSAMKGGSPVPANIMILVDTTPSMDDTDTTGDCTANTIPGLAGTPSKEDCAKWGVRTMMSQLAPCPLGLSSCGAVTNGNVQNAVDEVSIMTFPGLASPSDQTKDYTGCETNKVTLSAYAPATPSATPPYYTVVPLSSDYKTSDTSGLNGGSSPAVQAVDWADGAGCPAQTNSYGLQSPNGPYDTYFTSTIQQAQTILSALPAPRSSMQSAIIFLSDGDATAVASDFVAGTPAKFSVNECHQADNAAAIAAQSVNAANLKTWVYSVAWASSTWTWGQGGPNSGSCKTDAAPIGNSPISGCDTMQGIASDPNKFYADQGLADDNGYGGHGSPGCVSPAHPTKLDLSQIFSAISGDFYYTRLLPWGTT
jgi:Flp pilus assembly protein TadG